MITVLNIRGRHPPRKGGVPETDTRGASPHALPFAPTRPNGTERHLEAILWGLRRAFTPNPSTFTSQRRKTLRDAFIQFGWMPRLRQVMRSWLSHCLPSVHRRPICATPPSNASSRRRQSDSSVTPNVGCGRPCVKAARTLSRPCWGAVVFGVVPTVSRRHSAIGDHVGVGWPVANVSRGQMVCRCLGFGGFPPLSLWITQVSGDRFCDGIVKGL